MFLLSFFDIVVFRFKFLSDFNEAINFLIGQYVDYYITIILMVILGFDNYMSSSKLHNLAKLDELKRIETVLDQISSVQRPIDISEVYSQIYTDIESFFEMKFPSVTLYQIHYNYNNFPKWFYFYSDPTLGVE